MDKTAKMYLKSLRGLLANKNWYPTWITNMKQIKLGDVGILDENYFFETKTSLKTLGINFNEQHSKGDSDFLYQTEGGVDYEVKAAGEVAVAANHIPLAKAGIIFNLKKKGSVYVQATEYYSVTIPDVNDLEAGIIQLMNKGKWKNEWCIVTEVNETPKFAFLICTQSNGKLEVSADTSLVQNAMIALGNPNITFSVQFGDSAIFQQLNNNNAVMAYQIYRVKKPQYLPISESHTVSIPFSVTERDRPRSSAPSVEIERGPQQSESREFDILSSESSIPSISQPESHLLEIVRD